MIRCRLAPVFLPEAQIPSESDFRMSSLVRVIKKFYGQWVSVVVKRII